MKIKGSSVQQTIDFVKEKYPSRYEEWLGTLPAETKKIMTGLVMPVLWYPLQEGVIIPTMHIGNLFYNDPIKGSHEVGRYSAEKALKGIYKVFVRISTPSFMISRASSIFLSYYDNAQIQAVEINSKKTELHFFNFTEDEKFIFHRVAGWVEGALSVLKAKNTKTMVDFYTKEQKFACKITITWD